MVGLTALAASDAAAAAPVTFHDGFTSSHIMGWHSPGSPEASRAWSSSEGLLSGRGVLLAKTNWANYDFTLSARNGGVVFRYVNAKNFYRLTVGPRGARLAQEVAGRARTIASNRRRYAASNVIHVIAAGGSAKVAINGRYTFGFTRGKLRGGDFGVYGPRGPLSHFDKVAANSQAATFELVVMPDTQNEVQYRPSYLDAEMSWVAEHRGLENIGLVLQEGDVVNELADPGQWQRASARYGLLRDELPVQVCAGNHDVEDYLNDTAPYPTRPGPYTAFVRGLRMKVGGSYRGLLNTYAEYHVGGVRWLVVSLEFGAPDSVLAWARGVVKRHPGDHAILLTHDYVGERNEWRAPPDADLPHDDNPSLNDGIDIWRKLVSRTRIQWVFNGHVITGTAGRRVDRNPAGRVYQMMFNRQNDNLGAAYMRILRFDPAARRVDVRSFSPIAGDLVDPSNRFSIRGVNL